jgi:hypothetical protein
MKTTFELEDIQPIVQAVIEGLKPYLSQGKPADTIFDKKTLSEYLKVDISWIDRNVYALPHFYLGKYVRFKQSHIDKWIDGNRKMPSSLLKMVR